MIGSLYDTISGNRQRPAASAAEQQKQNAKHQ
jgi:hypothetical protein